MIGAGGQFSMEPEGTNIGPVLILHSMGYEGFVGNGHGVFAGLPGFVANHEAVFASHSACGKSNILHDELIGHQPPISWGSDSLPPAKGGRARTSARPFVMLEADDVLCLQALGALADFEFHSLALIQAPVSFRLNGRVMHENILAALALNESETLAGIKPLHSSLFFH